MFRLATKNGLKLARLSPLVRANAQSEQLVLFQQSRTLFNFGKIMNDYNAKIEIAKLQKQADLDPSQENLTAYFKALTANDPKQAVVNIERAWASGKLPVNDVFLKAYLNAAHKLGKLDTINIAALLAMVEKGAAKAPSDAAGAASGSIAAAELNALIRSAQIGGTGFNAGAGAGAAGSTTDSPLYTTAVTSWRTRILNGALTVALVLGIVVFINASMATDEKGGGGGLASKLGLSHTVKRVETSDKTFKDVVGIDEAKSDLEEIVLYLRDPAKFTRLGGQLPKGVLLTGPPGTGKTLLARAIAGEAKVPFFHASGSEFDEMFVGVGAKRIRDMFKQARENGPSIIFIDEIDAIGGKRSSQDQSAMRMTLNQLLTEMDGFEQNSGVIVIGATNFPDSLDKALVRPGRFDKHVDVALPDIGGRTAILEHYAKKIPTDKDVNFEQIARGTPGFSGADLYNLINQAALRASIENHAKVGMAALEFAKDKIMMGAARTSAIISPETMKTTAYHEAGHALIALKTDGANPIYKATIMPRGRALGMVMQISDGDQTSWSRKQMLAHLDICMGGRVAEELIFGYDNVTSGASSDIQSATSVATRMVKEYGLSDKVGFIHIDEKASGASRATADAEIEQLLQGSYARAKQLLAGHKRELEIVAKGLLEYESLSGSEIVDLINGRSISGIRSQKPSRATKPLPTKGAGLTTITSVDDSSSSSGSSSSGSSGSKGSGSGNNTTTTAAQSKAAAGKDKVVESKKQ